MHFDYLTGSSYYCILLLFDKFIYLFTLEIIKVCIMWKLINKYINKLEITIYNKTLEIYIYIFLVACIN